MSPHCGPNQSHTHYTSTINAKACQRPCPRLRSAALPDHVSARPTSVWAWLPPCQPGYTVLSVPVLYCYDAWVLSAAARPWHTTVFSGCWDPFGNANVCSNYSTCDYLFSFACQRAACLNGELHNGIMGYCQIYMIDGFIHKVCFCNSEAGTGSNTRVHLQRLSSQQGLSKEHFASQPNLKTLKLLWLFFSVGRSCFQICEGRSAITPVNLPPSLQQWQPTQCPEAGCWWAEGRWWEEEDKWPNHNTIWTHLYLPHRGTGCLVMTFNPALSYWRLFSYSGYQSQSNKEFRLDGKNSRWSILCFPADLSLCPASNIYLINSMKWHKKSIIFLKQQVFGFTQR